MQWVDYFHDLVLLKTAGAQSLTAEWTPEQETHMKELIQEIALDDLQVAFQQIYQASEQIFRSDAPKILLDLLLVKLVHGAPFQPLGQVLAGKVVIPAAETGLNNDSSTGKPTGLSQRDEGGHTGPPLPSNREAKENPVISNPQQELDAKTLLEKVLVKQPQVKAILDHALAMELDGEKLQVSFDKASLWVDMFQEKRGLVAELLTKELGRPIEVVVGEQVSIQEKGEQAGEPRPALPDDPVLREALEVLNATVKEVRKL